MYALMFAGSLLRSVPAADVVPNETEPAWRWAAPQIQTTVGYDDLEAKLSLIEERQYTAGEPIELQALLECTSGSWTVHDPFFAHGGMSALLVVFSNRDVCAVAEPERRAIPVKPIALYEGRGIGATFTLRTAPRHKPLDPKEPRPLSECLLGPGEYSIQLVVGKHMATEHVSMGISVAAGKNDATQPDKSKRAAKPRNIRVATDVLLRSNVVTIEIVDEQQSSSATNKRPVGPSGFAVGLTAKEKRVCLGEQFPVQITLRNNSKQVQVIRDPFLTETIPTSVQLRISNLKGEVIGNLIGNQFSGLAPGTGAIVTLPPGGVTLRVWRFQAGAVPQTEFQVIGNRLPTGAYRLQGVLRQGALFWHPHNDNDVRMPEDVRNLTMEERWKRWTKDLAREIPDATVSPTISLEILPAEAAASSDR